MSNTKPLILTLEGKWFHMILSEEKKEEYREIKPYWTSRFTKYFGNYHLNGSDKIHFKKEKKEIIFRNGYQKESPEFTALVTISEKEGNSEWGAVPGETYYTLQIHDIYNKKNC